MSAPVDAPQPALRSVVFRREREESWRALERLLDGVDQYGLRGLSAAELERLPRLYRAVLSSLSVARAVSLDRNLLDYLEGLAARAYIGVYGRGRPLSELAREFVMRTFPAAVRAHGLHVLVSLLVMLAGAAVGHELVAREPGHFYALVSSELAGDRGPGASREALRAVLYDRGAGADWLLAFAMSLFTHNSQVSLLAAALGFIAGLPTLLLLFQNGAMLGAFGALYGERGLALEFWAWVLPHGITELLAIVLCGGAGLAIGEGLLFPGRLTRRASLAVAGRGAAPIVIGCLGLLLIAGLLEGLFRQLVQDVNVRLVVALTSLGFWTFYFGFVGRQAPSPAARR
jgi:uncharacterized membrane protein SpoIIM required for sporulation